MTTQFLLTLESDPGEDLDLLAAQVEDTLESTGFGVESVTKFHPLSPEAFALAGAQKQETQN